jgi:hypothetical protein
MTASHGVANEVDPERSVSVLTVLIVEDEGLLAMLAEDIVTAEGHQAISVARALLSLT